MSEDAVYWYERADAARFRVADAAERLRVDELTRAILMAMPAGATLREFNDAGRVRLTIPLNELEYLDAVDAAFRDAGFVRGTASPDHVYSALAEEFNSPDADAERRAARDRYIQRSAAEQ